MKHTISKRSGAGGAHIGFAMFGARGPLRNGEDTGNTASASPTTPVVATPPSNQGDPATAPGAAASPQEKMLPQSQVNTLIAEAKRDAAAKARAQALHESGAPQATPPAAPAPKSAPAAPAAPTTSGLTEDVVQVIVTRARSLERVMTSAGLNERQIARMEAAFATERPSDVATWGAQYIEDLGIAKPAAAPVPATTAAATEAPKAPPAAAPAAPTGAVTPTTSNGLVDLFKLSSEQLDAMGPFGVKEHFEKALAVGRQQSGAPPRPKLPPR